MKLLIATVVIACIGTTMATFKIDTCFHISPAALPLPVPQAVPLPIPFPQPVPTALPIPVPSLNLNGPGGINWNPLNQGLSLAERLRQRLANANLQIGSGCGGLQIGNPGCGGIQIGTPNCIQPQPVCQSCQNINCQAKPVCSNPNCNDGCGGSCDNYWRH